MMSNGKALEILQQSLDKGLLCICGGMFSNSEIIDCREALNTALSALSGEHGQLKKRNGITMGTTESDNAVDTNRSL